MIHILHYITGIANIKGGVETFILNQFAVLDKEKYSFSILTRNANVETQLYKRIVDAGIAVYDLKCSNLSAKSVVSFREQIDEFFQKHEGEFDFLHSHCCDDPFIIAIAKKHGVKEAALHVHSIIRENENPILKFLKNICLVSNIHSADHLLACSNEAGKQRYKNRMFTVVKNAISINKFSYNKVQREIIRKKYDVEDEICFCYTGRFMAVKNLSFLISVYANVVKSMPNSKLFLIGDGEEHNILYSQIKSLGIEKNVIITGEVDEVYPYLSAMDVFLQTSKSEGFSISALEAQCNGLIAFISDGFPLEIKITDLINVISLADDSITWASKITQYISNINWLQHNIARKEYASIIEKNGYDNSDVCKELCLMYDC